MNREQIQRAFHNYDQAFNALTRQQVSLGKSIDKVYLDHLTSRMMWDCLLTLLQSKGILLSGEFDKALKELAEETQKAMQKEAQKKAEASPAPPAPAPVP